MRIPIFARLRALRGPLAGLIVGLALVAVGVFLAFFASTGSSKDAGLIDTAYVRDKAALDVLAPDTEVVIEGVLQDNTELDENGFVGYVTHRLVQRSSDATNGKRTHQWQFFESNFGLLNLEIDGGSVLMTAPSSISVLSGDPVEIIDTSEEFVGRPDTFVYDGQTLTTGAKRIRGVRNGDRLTVIGTRTGSGGIFLRRVHAGDRDSFRAALEEEAAAGGIFGYVALGLGLIVFLISLASVFRGRSAGSLRQQPA